MTSLPIAKIPMAHTAAHVKMVTEVTERSASRVSGNDCAAGSEVVAVFSYFLFLTLYFFSVTVTGRCSRENCHVYASCLADPLSGIANCACQIGFIGDGLKCQGVYIFTS